MPAYVKTTWVNGSTEPISADNLNNIEGGIENAAAKDVANVFTDVQSATAVTEDNSVAFTSGNNIKIIATAANLTVTSQTINTSGTLVISSAENITGFGV